MYSTEALKEMNDKAAREAKRAGVEPYLIKSQAEIDSWPPFPFPNIGSLKPKGWTETETFFVDSSGLGASDEPALSTRQFIQKLKVGRAYAITAEGQFQVYVTEYVKKKTSIPRRSK